ncbi:MAG: hypothetical protein R3264_18175, partial [Anaerolineae bacterium]|nr:hypothetical protein [Anaerolineae bacterium]
EVQVRLSDTPDDFIAGRFYVLKRQGFHLQHAAGEDQRVTSAILRRWAWWGPVVFYGGVITLIGALLASSFWFQRDQVRLFSSDSIFSHTLAGSLQLQPAQPDGSTYEIRYQPGDLDQPVRNFSLQPYRPIWLRGAIVMPTALDRLLNIEVKDGSGRVLELTQLQEVLDQTERLTIPVRQLNDPLLFSIVSSDLALQISPEPFDDDRLYTLQVRQGVTGELLNDVQIRVNEPITIASYSGLLSESYAADVIVWQDPAWWLYPLAGLLILVGAVSTRFFPPVVVWLIPEIKGRGGQLFGVVETFGREQRLKQFLTDLLPADEPTIDPE